MTTSFPIDAMNLGYLIYNYDPGRFHKILKSRQPDLAAKFIKSKDTYGEPAFLEVGVYVLWKLEQKDEPS